MSIAIMQSWMRTLAIKKKILQTEKKRKITKEEREKISPAPDHYVGSIWHSYLLTMSRVNEDKGSEWSDRKEEGKWKEEESGKTAEPVY